MPTSNAGNLCASESLLHFVSLRLQHLQRTLYALSLTDVVRLVIVVVLMLNFVIGAWTVLIAKTAYAMSLRQAAQAKHSQHPQTITVKQVSHVPQNFTLFGPGVSVIRHHAVAPLVSSSQPFDGLGDLPFYSYIKHPITSTSCSCGGETLMVNIATGNLLEQNVDMQIAGTGQNLDIEGYYNSRSNSSRDLGYGWNLSVGPDVRLDLSNPSAGITYHGPSGFSAYFTYNSSTGKYMDAPGLGATLTKSNGTYTLEFHSTGLKYNFTSGGYLANMKDINNNTITMHDNSSNQLTSITDTQGRTVNVTSNTSGQITQLADPLNNTVIFGYDSNGNLTSITDLNGHTTTFGYNGHDMISVTDALNNVTTIAYDSSDRVSTITDPLGGVTKFTYNSGNTVVTDADGHTTTYYYDSNLKLTSYKDALGNTRNISYNSNYNVTQQTDYLGNTTSYSYDSSYNLTAQTDANNNSVTFSYTNSSLPYFPTSAKDKQGNSTYYTYDGVGNIVTVRDGLASQNEMDYTYNSNGTLATAKDADGNTTSYSYDSKGNLIGVTPPSPLGSESFTYDGLSRVISSTDGKGQTTTYTYNNLNKLTKIAYADGSSISYTYDVDNNLVTEVDSTGTTTFTYDALNRMTGKSLPNGTTISYTYDKVGNLLTYTDAGGTVTYGYNAVNLPTTITDPSGAKTTYNYDADVDKMTSIAYPNGITTSYTYDDDRHVTSIVAKNSSGTSLMSFTYTYHGDLVSTVTDLNNNKTTYSYDALNRLTEAVTDNSSGVQTAKYEYPLDGAGNILAIKLNGVTTNTLTYNAANELVSNVGSSTINYTYDADGNLTSDGTLNYTYNAANQTTGIGTDTYSYTGPDQTDRVQANNTSYTYGSLGLGSATTSGSSVYYTRDSSGKLISERTPTGTYYYLTNNIGSVMLVADSTGKVQNSYSYDPLGNSLGKTENVTNPWQFAGGYLNATTGLYKFGTRYYNPTVGRWTQPDPKAGNITDINSLARYAYADDDPVNVTDPSGRGQGECLIAILNVIGQLLAFAWVIGLIAQALLLLIADPVTLIAAFFLLIVYGGTAAVAVVLTVWNLEIAPACGLPVVKVNGF